jgi:hypothetical protein
MHPIKFIAFIFFIKEEHRERYLQLLLSCVKFISAFCWLINYKGLPEIVSGFLYRQKKE